MKKLWCKIFGHKRGKRIAGTDTIECPHCKATWTRKPNPRKATA